MIGWLLATAAETGLPLTATGALNRATVRECVARRPTWYPREWSAPNRETDVAMLHEIARLLDVSKLVRKRKGIWHATKQAKALAYDPIGLRQAHLGNGFTGAVAVLVLCVLLTAADPLDPDELTPTILDDGWRADGQPLSRHHVIRPVYDTIRVLIALDVNIEWAERGALHGQLTPTGRAFAAHALRANATAPRVR